MQHFSEILGDIFLAALLGSAAIALGYVHQILGIAFSLCSIYYIVQKIIYFHKHKIDKKDEVEEF